ncbi:MAG: ribosome biogenesis protein, partial [Nitrososphaerota archaeon]
LFKEKTIKSGDKVLLRLEKKSFKELLEELKPSKAIGLSRIGKRKSLVEIALELSSEREPCIVIGGFPRGHFLDDMLKCFDAIYSIHDLPLETHLVVARALYEYEKIVLN